MKVYCKPAEYNHIQTTDQTTNSIFRMPKPYLKNNGIMP